MTIKFDSAVEIARELSKQSGKIMAIFEYKGAFEVVTQDAFDTLFTPHGLERLAAISPSGKIFQ